MRVWWLWVVLAVVVADARALAVDVRDEPGRVVLSNDALSIALGKPEKGAVVSLVDQASGAELVAETAEPWLLLVAVSRRDGPGDDKTYLASASAEAAALTAEADGPTASCRVSFTDIAGRGVDAEVTATVSDDDSLIRWRATVRVPEGLVLEEVIVPNVVLRAPLVEGSEDLAVLGHTKGGVFRRPSAWEPGTSATATQPGSMAAEFACYYTPELGVYTAAYDATGYPKRVELRRTDEGIRLVWAEYCFAAGEYTLGYDIALTTFTGGAEPTDWRHAADIYKSWALTQRWCAKTFAEREDVPAWMQRGAPFVRFHRGSLARPETIERWLLEYWKRYFPEDLPLTIAYWGWEKVESWVTPDYFPVFPSDEAFRELTAMNRRIGGHVFPWPSGYHYTLTFDKREDGSFRWDDRERFDAEPRLHAVHRRNGELYTMNGSWLRGGSNACVCPGDPWTIDWLNDIGLKLADRGADMIQVDQVVGGNYPACYRTDHGHPPGPGVWQAQAFERQLVTMRDRLRETDPEAVVCFEEPNERFIHRAAIQDYRDCDARWSGPQPELASVFGYIYHEYLPTFQSNPRREDQFARVHCLVSGQIPHFLPTEQIGPGPLLMNGDFEEWAGDVPHGWDRVSGWQGKTFDGKCYRDTEIKQLGATSMRLANEGDDTAQVSQNIFVGRSYQVGGTYRLTAWIRTEGLERANAINFANLTSDLKGLGGGRLEMPAGDSDWAQRGFTFTVPEGTDFLRIMCHVDGPGQVWIDGLRLYEVLRDGTLDPVQRPETPDDHEFMKQWVELYSGEGLPYLLHGETLHPPALRCATIEYRNAAYPAILHNAYRAPDGSEALVVANATDAPQHGSVEWIGGTVQLDLEPWQTRLIPSPLSHRAAFPLPPGEG